MCKSLVQEKSCPPKRCYWVDGENVKVDQWKEEKEELMPEEMVAKVTKMIRRLL